MDLDLTTRLDDAHLSVYNALPADLLDLSDIPATRQRFAELRAAMPVPAPIPGLVTEDHAVAGPEGDPEIMVRTYRPADLPAGAPALYWIHGGGMILGNVEMNDDSCAAIADDLQILVASVEYRLAPEHPYPAPMEDCYAGLRWLHAGAAGLGIDAGRIAIGGGSAGGGLAAGLALLARDRAEVPVVFQLLVYPMIDDRNCTPMSQKVTDRKVWNRHANQVGWDAYLGVAAGGEVPVYAAPARAEDLAGLPPAYINVGDLDLFFDEDVDYARRLAHAGVPVELHVYPGAFHGSNFLVSESTLSRRWTADERAALRRALRGESP